MGYMMKETTNVMDGRPQGIDLSHPDPELYKHLPKVVDAVTGSCVTPATALVELYQFTEPSVDDTLLRNLSGVARPKVPCQLVVADGQYLPHTERSGERDCLLRLTFNKLLLAPTVRLEAHFMYGESTQRENILTLVLEWHFNNYGNDAPGIRDYNRRDNEISFTAGAATCSGFNNLIDRYPHLDERCQEIATLLQSFLENGPEHRIRLRLHTARLTEDELFQLQKLYTRLPGGADLLLPSIGQGEYSTFGEHDTHIDCASDTHIRRPYHLLQGAAKHPMVPLECGDTFSTVKEAGVQFAYAASAEHAEQSQALKLWSGVPHTGCIYRRGHIFTLGIRYSKYRVLGGVKGGLCLRLPDDLSCKIAMKPLLGEDADVLEASATLTYNTSAFPPADALFILRGSLTKKENGDVVTWDAVPDTARYEVHFAPRANQITFQRQLRTIADLQAPRSSRWHPILLNQVHRRLPTVNLTSGSNVPNQAQAAALQWLRNWQQWNQEQLSVIHALEDTKGGMVIVMGPAGTGKTLLQQGLAIYFYKLGYRILALAPANSNVDHMARALHKYQAEIPELGTGRLYPSSRAYTAVETTRQRGINDKMNRPKSSVLTYTELLVAIEEYDQYSAFARPYGVVEQVLLAAFEEKLKANVHISEGELSAQSYDADAWELLRGLIAKYRSGELGDQINGTYRKAYEVCKQHWMETCRFIVTTTGNVRANELLTSWKSNSSDSEKAGVVVFVDEAAKDHEVNLWSGVVCASWGSKVQGVFLFGDDKQLTPTNTSAKGDVQFNAFKTRLDISLPCRLVREGFPCFRLVEQHRMHPSISAFPNESFYNGALRNGPLTGGELESIQPGLKTVLQHILVGDHAMSTPAQALSDQQARLAWLEVSGRRCLNDALRSVFVQEHIDHFFHDVFPQLQEFYHNTEQNLKDNLMIICAYKAALFMYKDRFQAMLRDRSVTEADVPRILTVDASQGEESFMVIFDASCQHGDVVGFMNAAGRCNVATTRAKAVFWIIGGAMRNLHKAKGNRIITHLARYKYQLDRTSNTHRARRVPLQPVQA